MEVIQVNVLFLDQNACVYVFFFSVGLLITQEVMNWIKVRV